MNRILAAVLLVLFTILPAHAQDSVELTVVLIIPSEVAITTPTGCTAPGNPRLVTATISPIPYSESDERFFEDGRFVHGASSPIEGVDGCMLERKFFTTQADAYAIDVFLLGAGGRDLRISLGEVSWEQYNSALPTPLVYVIDQEAIDSQSASPVNFDPPPVEPSVPELLATIEAQEKEIEDLKATIEAIETPTP